MRDLRKTLSLSIDHLHDLIFDRFDENSLPFGASYTGTIYREGYLFKQSRRMRKFWKTRYFVLRNDGLFYFHSKLDKDGEPRGYIPLKRLSVHLDVIKDKGRPKYCLRLGSGHSFKTFYCLCCFSNEERNLWVTSLLTAISQDMVSNCSYAVKYSHFRTSSSGSSTESIVSEPNYPLGDTLKPPMVFTSRPTSCELGSLFRVGDRSLSTYRPSDHRRPNSLTDLTELKVHQGSQKSPKKSQKPQSKPLRRLKALSSLDGERWKGSYIDLST